MAPAATRQRLDKWLWFSRCVKTRALAVQLIEQGFVRIDGKRAEQASKLVGAGNTLTIALERKVLVWEILGCAEALPRDRRSLGAFATELNGMFKARSSPSRPRLGCLGMARRLMRRLRAGDGR
jgi:ribosome-associated heat shock protein Hsp15